MRGPEVCSWQAARLQHSCCSCPGSLNLCHQPPAQPGCAANSCRSNPPALCTEARQPGSSPVHAGPSLQPPRACGLLSLLRRSGSGEDGRPRETPSGQERPCRAAAVGFPLQTLALGNQKHRVYTGLPLHPAAANACAFLGRVVGGGDKQENTLIWVDAAGEGSNSFECLAFQMNRMKLLHLSHSYPFLPSRRAI